MPGRNNMNKPFLKWAGNKFRIIDTIRTMLPEGSRLVEPFAGSGAVFLNTDYDRYLLADSNADLISLFTIVRDQGESFIAQCEKLFRAATNQEAYYYRRRDEFNKCKNPERKAALFVYLNRHGYNGLCRYNAGGGFNVPFGRYKKPYFPARELQAFHERAQRAQFIQLDFSQVFAMLSAGDVVYCDPPYVPLSKSASFTSYSAGGFDLHQQSHLAELAQSAKRQGVPVLISNHNTRFTRDAYQEADNIKRLQVKRMISCQGQKRHSAAELLALFECRVA
jgi:DNA adenine methylase